MAVTQIFAVTGNGNVGKTYTLNLLAQQFEDKKAKRIDGPDPLAVPPGEDHQYVYEWNNHCIGIGTKGDTLCDIRRHFNHFAEYQCDTVVVSCRLQRFSNGKSSADELEAQAKDLNLIADCTTLFKPSDFERQKHTESEIAKRIFSRI